MTLAADGPGGDDLRAAMARFPTGVVIATTIAGGEDHVTTLNSLTSVSLDPPLVLVSLGVGSRFAARVEDSGVWGVGILADDAADLARRFAARERDLPALARVRHHRGLTGVALLDDAIASLECRTHAVHRAGDHDIVVGRVVATELAPGETVARPLVVHRGSFGGFAP